VVSRGDGRNGHWARIGAKETEEVLSDKQDRIVQYGAVKLQRGGQASTVPKDKGGRRFFTGIDMLSALIHHTWSINHQALSTAVLLTVDMGATCTITHTISRALGCADRIVVDAIHTIL